MKWPLAALLPLLSRQQGGGGLLPTAPSWCAVPNYRYYRFTPTKARGFPVTAARDCSALDEFPDGCPCTLPIECKSGYCIDGLCAYPAYQVSEVEFWRRGKAVRHARPLAPAYEAYHVLNDADVPMTWGVWELEFYSDTSCSVPIAGGTPIASSELQRGFGHFNPHARGGPDDSLEVGWQSTPEIIEGLGRHGPKDLAFDGDLRSNWWARCKKPCQARTEWIGKEYAVPPALLRCVRIAQAEDIGYVSVRLAVRGRRTDGVWETLARIGWQGEPGGANPLWRRLSLPQGTAYPTDMGHARGADGDLNSSVVERTGSPLEYDFGVVTEIDAWRWATAEEPLELFHEPGNPEDPYSCAHDGFCPRDPVRWRLEGSLDRGDWTVLQNQATDYPVTVYRKQFLPFQPVHHEVQLGISDIWPDGRSKCAARR